MSKLAMLTILLIFAGIFLWALSLFFTGWFLYMMGSGEWGGGKEVIDFRPCMGGGEPNRYRILKKGPLYMHYAGGNQAIVVRSIGMMKTENVGVERSDFIPVGSKLFFHGMDGLKMLVGIYVSNTQSIIIDLKNRLSQVNNELQRKTHNIQQIMEENIKIIDKTTKAMNSSFGGAKKSTGGRK